MTNNPPDIANVLEIAREAGKAIMEIYGSEFGHELKGDQSPLTKADLASHEVIVNGLRRMSPDIPALSEEDATIPFAERSAWTRYWLVDPLDGTKEFIKRNGEFTVNIALVEEGTPILGVVTAPALNKEYWGIRGRGAWKKEGENADQSIACSNVNGGMVVAESRSHPSPELETYLAQFTIAKRIVLGSSLKFCAVAEGSAHLYARLGPMMDWDIGAGHCIVEAAGGTVRNVNGGLLDYGTKELRISTVIAKSS